MAFTAEGVWVVLIYYDRGGPKVLGEVRLAMVMVRKS